MRFIGLDVNYNQVGRDKVMAWLKQNAPDKVADAAATFQVLAEEEGKWPMLTNAERVKTMLPAVQRVVAAVQPLAGKGADPLDDTYLHARIMEQWVRFVSPGGNLLRSASMGENLLYILNARPLKGRPELKVMYYASNNHAGRGYPDGTATAGKVIGDALGSKYYALALEFYRGTFRCRTVAPDRRMGDYGQVEAPVLDDASLPGVLHKAKSGNLLLDLNGIPTHAANVSTWFGIAHQGHAGAWACSEDRSNYAFSHAVGGRFNGLMFVETITPTLGTANALKISAGRRVF